ncbi:MAG TPA: carboxypeptidase regulatory-like domain-containing protein, partial [Candidatus Limnocylindria bacterium]|nr:carboxypeptidase regulatory-like domain-containing protein [Candidatus Limnocylindria bacterium]
ANVSGITMKLPGQKTFSIAGKITRASDGTPVANASVSVSGPVGGSATTNSQGVYKISGLLAGDYTLGVSPASGANLQTGCLKSGSPGNFTAVCGGASTLKITNADLTGRNVALPNGKKVTGKVMAGGTGVNSASIVAISQDGRASGFASTDSSGAFTIVGLAPGKYKFSVGAPYGSNLRSGFWTDANANRWVATVGQAAAPNVTADKNLGTIKPPAGFKIAGNVKGPDNAPIAYAWVTATSGSNSAFGFTDFDGNYEIIGLAPGNWTLMFEPGFAAPTLQRGWYKNNSTGFTPTQAQATAITVGPNKTGLKTKLPTGFSISGRVTKSGGGGVQTSLLATRASDGASFFAFGASDGSYQFTGLGAGEYTVQAFSPSGANLVGGFYKAGAPGNYTPAAGQATKVPIGP